MARWSRQMNENTAEMLSTSEKAICLKFRLVLSIHARALVGIFVWYREKVMVFLLCPLHYLIVTISFYFISYLLIFTPCLLNHFSFFLFCCFSIPAAVYYPTFLFISCKIKKKKSLKMEKWYYLILSWLFRCIFLCILNIISLINIYCLACIPWCEFDHCCVCDYYLD